MNHVNPEASHNQESHMNRNNLEASHNQESQMNTAQDLVLTAHQRIKTLQSLRQDGNVSAPFAKRLASYEVDLHECIKQVEHRDYQLAFIGKIGAGKSTAICHLFDLITLTPEGRSLPLLEIGGGGTTVCEVEIRQGDFCGVRVTPCAEEEVMAYLRDFADGLRGKDVDSESQGLSAEINRAIRNLCGLVRSQGKDPAQELADSCDSEEALVAALSLRLGFERRTAQELKYSGTGDQLAWLKESFRNINYGRHPEVSLPKRIELIIPASAAQFMNFRIIDTKGIDRSVAREDLQNFLSDPFTVPVFCSGFNDAPSVELRQLMEWSQETGGKCLQERSALLILALPEQALAVRDDAGNSVDDAQSGYQLKMAQASQSLSGLNLAKMPMHVYNAKEDRQLPGLEFFNGILNRIHVGFRRELEQCLEEVDQVLSHQAQSDSLAQRQEVSRKLLEWMESHRDIKLVRNAIESPLLREIKGAHFRCLRASVKRQGDWGNLSFPQLLGGGARSRAVATLTPLIHRFSQRCEELAADPELQAASELPKQSQRTFANQCEEIQRRCEAWGRQQAIKAIKADPQLWERCAAERGLGQKNRLQSNFNEWFRGPSWQEQTMQLDKLITSSWSELLKNLRSILEE